MTKTLVLVATSNLSFDPDKRGSGPMWRWRDRHVFTQGSARAIALSTLRAMHLTPAEERLAVARMAPCGWSGRAQIEIGVLGRGGRVLWALSPVIKDLEFRPDAFGGHNPYPGFVGLTALIEACDANKRYAVPRPWKWRKNQREIVTGNSGITMSTSELGWTSWRAPASWLSLKSEEVQRVIGDRRRAALRRVALTGGLR